ncbi:MAG TPA: response regulator [Terriglobales bacterium]|nr:response regulator [Terriglobales bacterium]
MKQTKILLVDDNTTLLAKMKELLELHDFEVVPAASVTEALNQIVTQHFDVLLTDLHMPDPGDGFAVVTAMRHAQPEVLTLVVSGFPDVQGAMAAILLQADEVLVKPLEVEQLAKLIQRKTQERGHLSKPRKESIATILERDVKTTIQRWLMRVGRVEALNRLQLTEEQRTQHLHEIMSEIVVRLRGTRFVEAIASDSPAAVAHGELRYRQGYSAPLMVQESRILQVCIFETIQRNLGRLDFSTVLPDIMIIADEVDSQLTQSIDSYVKANRAAQA